MAHSLYRFYDHTGELLYVGVTINPGARLAKHKDTKTWWNEVARVDLETYPDRSALLVAEREAIKTEAPHYNIRMNGNATAAPVEERIVWNCEVCGHPIEDVQGYLTVSYRDIRLHEEGWAEFKRRKSEEAGSSWVFYSVLELDEVPHRAAWKALHRYCDPNPDSNDYWFDVERIRTYREVIGWTAHLMGKKWILHTTWNELLLDLGTDS